MGEALLSSMPAITPAVGASVPSTDVTKPSWIDWLRCPVRNMVIPSGSSSVSGDCYCQEMIWRVLTAAQGITALLCSRGDFLILEATKTACLTWGAAALRGQSVLNLVSGPFEYRWLKRALPILQYIADTQSDRIPGFVIRDIGDEQFKSKTGQVFIASVIIVHLPAEAKCGNNGALLVIVEPPPNLNSPPAASANRQSARGSRQEKEQPPKPKSTQSEVSSVDPKD